jgi:hypothetical protein
MGGIMRVVSFVALLLLAALFFCPPVFASGAAVDHETITPGNTATGFTGSKIAKTTGTWAYQSAQSALITVEDNAINFTEDGTTPTQTGGTNVGHQMAAGSSYKVRGAANVANFRCIDRTAGSAAKVKATYYYGGE